jgi:Na+/proline symporter
MQALDFRFDLAETYTFWSGLIGGLFLMLSYFGCDQSQVQRYLTARSVQEGRRSLMMSAYAKIPLQALVLLTGVLVFAFYVFSPPPMLFNPVHDDRVRASSRAADYEVLQARFAEAFDARRTAALAVASARREGDRESQEVAARAFAAADASIAAVRQQGVELVERVSGDENYNDVNYVFPTFITTRMPIGLVGLMIAAIFAAAMSTIAGELSALSTATVIDFYRRFVRQQAPDRHFLIVGRIATGFWGIFASIVAVWAAELGSLIEVVNKFGSYFYGSILGVFILAVGFPRATANGAFVGLIAGMASVGAVSAFTRTAFLWLNVVGAVAVVVAGLLVSTIDRPRAGRLTFGVHVVAAGLSRPEGSRYGFSPHFPDACPRRAWRSRARTSVRGQRRQS